VVELCGLRHHLYRRPVIPPRIRKPRSGVLRGLETGKRGPAAVRARSPELGPRGQRPTMIPNTSELARNARSDNMARVQVRQMSMPGEYNTADRGRTPAPLKPPAEYHLYR